MLEKFSPSSPKIFFRKIENILYRCFFLEKFERFLRGEDKIKKLNRCNLSSPFVFFERTLNPYIFGDLCLKNFLKMKGKLFVIFKIICRFDWMRGGEEISYFQHSRLQIFKRGKFLFILPG